MRHQLIRLDPTDNVAVALVDLKAGTEVTFLSGGMVNSLRVSEAIPRCHKIALTDIRKGDSIIKHGRRVGGATKAIQRGTHAHVHNMAGLTPAEILARTG